jgi:predicted amidophosphoribosyltransferase
VKGMTDIVLRLCDVLLRLVVVERFYCPRCDEEVRKKQAFCSACGRKLRWKTPPF